MPFRWNPITGAFDLVRSNASENQVLESAKRLQITRIAAEDISALKVVKAASDTEVLLASSTGNFEDAEGLGVSITGANTGGSLEIITAGNISDALFSSFVLNQAIYLGTNGTMTQTPPSTGNLTRIGKSLGGNDIQIKIDSPIALG